MNNHATRPEIFSHLAALGDPNRAHMLLLLEGRELNVSELCAVLQAPQSTVSRHLKALSDGGWVHSRREGTSRWYMMAPAELEPGMGRLWDVIREDLAESSAALQHGERLTAVLALRRARSREFFSSAAGEWDRMRDEMFGAGFFFHAFPALLDPDWRVADLGCGTGRVAEALAPFVREVIAVDDSDEMLAEAGRRLEGLGNVDIRKGTIEELPIEDRSVDAATLVLVLHHLPEPEKALAEVARVLEPGGRLLVVDTLPHDREEYAQTMGHVWLGFSSDTLERHLERTGFEAGRVVSLAADPKAKGPALFAAAAVRSASRARAKKSESELETSGKGGVS